MDKQQVLEALNAVMDPELNMSLTDLGMVKHVGVENGTVELVIALTVSGCPLKEQIENDTRDALKKLDGFKMMKMQMTVMAPAELDALKKRLGAQAARINAQAGHEGHNHAAPKAANGPTMAQGAAPAHDAGGINRLERKVDHIIAITSGKGGVGKSSVTSMIALALQRMGKRVGILDADITGPSIARIFGETGRPKVVEPNILVPVKTTCGVSILSMNLMITDPNAPVIWRGPLVNGAIRQMYSQAMWEGMDYLLVDLPPGTSDANLTVFQSIPLTGVVIVTSPQDLVGMIVKKSISMAMSLNVPVLGLVENMAYVQPPGLDEPYYLFGDLKGEAIAEEARIPYLGALPIKKEFAKACDDGKIAELKDPVFEELAKKVLESEEKKGRFGKKGAKGAN